MKLTIALLFASLLSTEGLCQYFQFSQYGFSSQRVNPAAVAASDYAEISLVSRKQSTGAGFHLNTNLLQGSYPLCNRLGSRWSAIGVSVMDDRAGESGLFSIQEVALSYAVSKHLSKFSSLSLGIKGLHSRRKVDLNGLTTGLQYIPNRGFDESVENGESPGRFSQTFNTISGGIFWNKTDKKRTQVASAGLSFFDFNKADESFLGNPAQYKHSMVASVLFRAYSKEKVSIFPELLVATSAGKVTHISGLTLSYDLKSNRRGPSDRLQVITKYRSNNGPVLGLQLHREMFSVGASYDLPVFQTTVASHGAFEVALSLRKLVAKPQRAKRRRSGSRTQKVPTTENVKRTPLRTKDTRMSSDSTDLAKVPTPPTLADRLRAKKDSVRSIAMVGDMQHERLILEKANLHFKFPFNSAELDAEARAYLNELAVALAQNPDLKVELTGFTDNVGSPRFNLRLSIMRANAVRDYLVSRGVEESRINARGKGMEEPLNSNSTEEERALNRRVEMVISTGP